MGYVRGALVALAGIAAAAAAVRAKPAPQPVTYIGEQSVKAAFARGAPLVETAAYKVHASRREAHGEAEVHERDTDIIYVLQGTATFVTGGSVVEPRRTAPDEIRGRTIAAGETRQLVPGDVIIVPEGMPHWFQAVEPPFLYYVVKVTK